MFRYRKTTATESVFDNPAGREQIFYRRMSQQLARTLVVFAPVKKSNENAYISKKTESSH